MGLARHLEENGIGMALFVTSRPLSASTLLIWGNRAVAIRRAFLGRPFLDSGNLEQSSFTPIGVGNAEARPLTFVKVGAWSPHFCIIYCIVNNVTDNFILRYRYLH